MNTTNAIRTLYSGKYDSRAHEWRRIGALGKCDNVMRLCADIPHDSVMEIGAGDGAVLARLSELKFAKTYSAVEIAEGSVAAIKAQIPEVDAMLFNGHEIPTDQRFDLAILSHVVEHLEHPRQLIYEAARIADHVLIEVPLEDNLRMARDFVLTPTGHINFYSAQTFRHLIQSCGLTVRKQITANPPLAAYTFQKGRRGIVNYALKEALLRLPFAQRLLTYNCAILAQSTPRE